ncbi:hypothetical protein KFL_006430010 [Klebsormidium nitens]|uniref:Uncharacterized protein n=1 Tax=Klebsormidium nitens TaxID=105231 RepID=A0A1Y1II37_KLENI|nr:hypothetical protein KFL_006430010 [Klebsormidium nitens]|eukprot:GAQ90464.1 hypothetical protein KFL_006430010 [Klebsormidium nitens]
MAGTLRTPLVTGLLPPVHNLVSYIKWLGDGMDGLLGYIVALQMQAQNASALEKAAAQQELASKQALLQLEIERVRQEAAAAVNAALGEQLLTGGRLQAAEDQVAKHADAMLQFAEEKERAFRAEVEKWQAQLACSTQQTVDLLAGKEKEWAAAAKREREELTEQLEMKIEELEEVSKSLEKEKGKMEKMKANGGRERIRPG